MAPQGAALLEPADFAAAAQPAADDLWEWPFDEAPLAVPGLFLGGLGQGVAAGIAYLAPRDDHRDWLEDGYYVHVRYLYELSLLFAWEFDTGIYRADNKLKGIVPGEKDVEALPVRLTLQVHSDIKDMNARLYLLAGGGYFIYDDEVVDDEWGVHWGLGAEFGGLEANFSARLEAGHLRLTDSGVNQWTGALVLYYKF